MRGYLLVAIAGLLLAVGGYCAGRREAHTDDRIAAAQARVDTAFIERAARVETVTVTRRAIAQAETVSHAYHDTVQVIARDTLRVIEADTVVAVAVPPAVVARIESDSALIDRQRAGLEALSALVAADSVVIRRQAALLGATQAGRASPWWVPHLSAGYGLVASPDGSVHHGVTLAIGWRIR